MQPEEQALLPEGGLGLAGGGGVCVCVGGVMSTDCYLLCEACKELGFR